MRRVMSFCAAVSCSWLLASSGRAEETAQERAERQNTTPAPAVAAAAGGFLLPTALAPRIFSGSAFGVARAGHDGALRSFQARAAAESSPLDWLAVRVEFEHGGVLDTKADPEDRGRVGVLHQESAGIDAGDAGVRAVHSTGPIAQPSESTRTALGTIAMAGAGGAF